MSTSTDATRRVVCANCDREIDACYCCESPDCADPICLRDLILMTRESLPQPYTHG